MRIHSIRIENLGPFSELEEVRLGPMATIVGQNDVGKSYILRALALFFDKAKIDEAAIHKAAANDADVVVEVSFGDLPNAVELEEDVETTLEGEHLTDQQGLLRIRKVYRRKNLAKPLTYLVVHSFLNETYSGVPLQKEDGLNKLCEKAGLEHKKSGAGITNKGKREQLRAKAERDGEPLGEVHLDISKATDVLRCVKAHIPQYELFECDTRLGVGEMGFQKEFRPIVTTAAESPEAVAAKNQFTGAIGQSLQAELDGIFERLQRHTDAFATLTAHPTFVWDKAVTLDILARDHQGVETSFEQRGSGMRRLLMVAFFRYLAERGEKSGNFVFGIEEPENCLHPRLQRELATSFRKLSDEGYQVIVSSHSPVFAGASPVRDLALVLRDKGIARAIQGDALDLRAVAEELGVEPADQICTYKACVFVEGPDDVGFWHSLAAKLKDAGHLECTFEDRQIGFPIVGGDNLKHWVNSRAMSSLNTSFSVIVDSDRKSESAMVPARKVNWKKRVEEQGGRFFILRKREMENYIHPQAIERAAGLTCQPCDEYTDMKKLFGDSVWKLVNDMSADEILEMDRYEDQDGEHHELKEIAEQVLGLVV
ncbi:MAG: ATP-binding protein [Proteobacteria bacterium]|nr:ATP-binding protein [Pseudomonadota bacterium]